MINTPFIELDLHGMRVEQALAAIENKLAEAGPGVYKIKIIHGFNNGMAIKNAVFDEYRYGYGKVKRIAPR